MVSNCDIFENEGVQNFMLVDNKKRFCAGKILFVLFSNFTSRNCFMGVNLVCIVGKEGADGMKNSLNLSIYY